MVPSKVSKLALMKKSAASEEMGAKPGEYTLPEVAVRGIRPDLNKVTIHSDEYKSKKWHELKRKYNFSEPEDFNNVLSVGALPNFHETEEEYKKKPGAFGKVNVIYSDGVKRKLGDKYEPVRTYMTTPSNSTRGAGSGNVPDVKPEEKMKNGIVNEPESDKIGKSDWREWHKSKYPSKYKN